MWFALFHAVAGFCNAGISLFPDGLTRFRGDTERAAAVYSGVAEPLTAEDVAETLVWAVTRPPHVNVDLLVVRPRAQAAQHKVHRESAAGK